MLDRCKKTHFDKLPEIAGFFLQLTSDYFSKSNQKVAHCNYTKYLLITKEAYLHSALLWATISRHSGMAHVNKGSHTVLLATHTFIHKWNEPYLSLTPSHRVLPHFGWYSLSILLRAGGWVGLGGLVKYWGSLPAQRRSPIPEFVTVDANWTDDHRVASPTL